MKATTLLYRQHRRIAQLAAVLEFEKSMRNPLLLELVEEVMAHVALEHNLFYPAAQRALDVSVDAHRKSHEQAKNALLVLASARTDLKAFVANVQDLRRIVQRHTQLDETTLFPRVERVLDDEALEDLGEEMETFQGTLLSVCGPRAARDPRRVTRAHGAP